MFLQDMALELQPLDILSKLIFITYGHYTKILANFVLVQAWFGVIIKEISPSCFFFDINNETLDK